VSSIHGTEVEQFNSRSSVRKLGGIIGWRSKLLQNLSADASSWLLSLNHGAVTKVTLNKEHHLIILHQHLISADVVEPSLHQGLDSSLILVGTCSGRGQGGRDGGDERLRIGGYKVLGELDEFRV
jgi:hypothetical protein